MLSLWPLRKISEDAYLLANVPSPSSLTTFVPPTCCRAAAETNSPLSQQREWRRCSFPLLHACSVLHRRLVLHGAGPVQGAFISKSPGTASLRSRGEQSCPAAWEMPTAETLSIQAEPVISSISVFKLNLKTRVRNHKNECSLLYLPLSLAVFFKWLSCAKRYKLPLKQFLGVNVTFPPLIALSSDER